MRHEHNQRELCQQVYACIKTLAQDILGKTTLRETGPPRLSLLPSHPVRRGGMPPTINSQEIPPTRLVRRFNHRTSPIQGKTHLPLPIL